MKRFIPLDRGKLNLSVPATGRDQIYHSVRPVAYLSGLRSLGYQHKDRKRILSARDHAVYEILLAAAAQSDPTLSAQFHAVRVSSILAVLAGRTARDLQKSLDRLMKATFEMPFVAANLGRSVKSSTLPVRRIPTRETMPMRIRPIYTDEERAERRAALMRGSGFPLLKGGSGRGSLITKEASAVDRAMDSFRLGHPASPSTGERPRDPLSQPKGADIDGELRSSTDCVVADDNLACLPKAVDDDEAWRDEPPETNKLHVRPLLRWSKNQGVISFELASYLRYFLDRTRTVRDKKGRVRSLSYRHVDLRAFAGFSSGYTAAVYRSLIAATDQRRPLDGVQKIEMHFEDLSKLQNFQRQKTGSWRGQLQSAVLDPVTEDLKRLSASEMSVHVVSRNAEVLKDLITFEISKPLPDLRRLKRYALGSPGRYNSLGRHRKFIPLVNEERAIYVQPDCPEFAIQISTWEKIAGVLKVGHGRRLAALSKALDVAVDEMLNADDPYFGHQTTESETRPLRRERLRAAIDEFGMARTAVLFAVSEHLDPDLTLPLTIYRQTFDDTLVYVKRDKRERYAASRAKPPRTPGRCVRGQPSDDELERYLAAETLRLQQSDEAQATLARTRAEARSEKKRRQRSTSNSKRRERRLLLKRARSVLHDPSFAIHLDAEGDADEAEQFLDEMVINELDQDDPSDFMSDDERLWAEGAPPEEPDDEHIVFSDTAAAGWSQMTERLHDPAAVASSYPKTVKTPLPAFLLKT